MGTRGQRPVALPFLARERPLGRTASGPLREAQDLLAKGSSQVVHMTLLVSRAVTHHHFAGQTRQARVETRGGQTHGGLSGYSAAVLAERLEEDASNVGNEAVTQGPRQAIA